MAIVKVTTVGGPVVNASNPDVYKVTAQLPAQKTVKVLGFFPSQSTSDVASQIVVGEVPVGAIDGINAAFTTAFDFKPESVEVKVNGLSIAKVDEFNTSGSRNINLTFSPGPAEHITVNYIKA